jgi:hypothetical protein
MASLRSRPSSLFMLLGLSSISFSFLMSWFHVGFGGEQIFFWLGGGGGHAFGQVGCSRVCALPLPACWVQARCANGVFLLQCVCVVQLICPVAGDAAYTQVLQPQVVPHSTKEAGDLPGW